MSISSRAYITTVDGTKVLANKLIAGSSILGINPDGNLAPQKLISVARGKMRDDWFNVQGPRLGYSKGSAFFSGLFTADQEFKSIANKWVSVGDLIPDAKIIGIANSLQMSLVQKSILLGILLGDGTLKTAPTKASKALKWVHGVKQKDYLDWTVQALGAISYISETHTSGYGSLTHSARTVFHPEIDVFFDGFDKPNGDIPEWVANFINPISLAYWYMDDGSLSHQENQRDRVSLATNSFSMKSHEILLAGLVKLGIEGVIQPSAKGPSIRLNVEASDLFFSLIAPYIPPSMQYKLPTYYRGNQGWIPKTIDNFQEILVEGTVQKVIPYTQPNNKLIRDLELTTELGNFFSNGLLLKSKV